MNPFDAIIIGSGAGGSAAAYKLVTAGLRVAVVEKGSELPRDSSTLDFDKVVHRGLFKSKEQWFDGRGRTFAPEEYFNVGGKTKWYGAALLRFGRHEFDADPSHRCLGWPIDYDELSPYYEEAELLLGIRTFEAEQDLASIVGRLRRTSSAWRSEALPLGLAKSILDNPLEASRFDGFASVAGLKADAESAFLSKLRGNPSLKLLTGVPAVELLGESGNPRHIVGVRLADGRVLQAKAVLLAAGALHSPRLLGQYLGASGLVQQLPSAANVGRNLKLHLLTAVVAVSLSRKTDVIRKTTLLLNDALPHSSIQPLGFDGELIATLVPKVAPRIIARLIGQRAYGFFLQTEDGSHADNRVSAGAVPTLDYDATRLAPAVQQHERLVKTFKRALGRAGLLAFSERIGVAGTAHACGTLVTGRDPQRSVVDASGRVHGMDALYVVDGSILPRSSRVNPSLTIYSWSLRVARTLALRLQETRADERKEVVVS
ncbi:MAG TPA: GMC family oxidoreductase [Steroidobacteraceae bacterium]|nr:GMC family oxidoreductase [Steroidobacteraceae bacterium]